MKIQILSDIHLELEPFEFVRTSADVIVIAGDLHVGLKGIRWIQNQNFQCPVIYVPGNHEFYGHTYQKLIRKMISESAGTNIYFLSKSKVELDGVAFHGTTLWTDFRLLGAPEVAGAYCQQRMNDYRYIRREPTYSKMRSIDIFALHHEELDWLDSSLANSPCDRNIVISHHAPTAFSLPENERTQLISSAYASQLDDLILKHSPNCWFHGHIHRSLDYCIDRTRIVCNARGHQARLNDTFDPQLIIAI